MKLGKRRKAKEPAIDEMKPRHLMRARLGEARTRSRRLRDQLQAAQEKRAELEARVEHLETALGRSRRAVGALRDKVAFEQYLRIRVAIAHAGFSRYLLVPNDDGSPPHVPGYAQNRRFLTSRQEFVKEMQEREFVTATDRVLDVGCGIGGVAVFLLGVLGGKGSYVGVDIVDEAIEQCRANIGARHPNFTFHALDVRSRLYNPEGEAEASEVHFPFADGSFDLAILRSLFTHMLPADVERYMSELARMLPSGGRTVITFFMLDDAAREAIAEGNASRPFRHAFDGYLLDSLRVAETAVAIDEEWVLARYEAHGFEIVDIERGSWRDRSLTGFAHDTVYARKH